MAPLGGWGLHQQEWATEVGGFGACQEVLLLGESQTGGPQDSGPRAVARDSLTRATQY